MKGQKRGKLRVLRVLSILNFWKMYIIYEVGVYTRLSVCVYMCLDLLCVMKICHENMNNMSWKTQKVEIEKLSFGREGGLNFFLFSNWNLNYFFFRLISFFSPPEFVFNKNIFDRFFFNKKYFSDFQVSDFFKNFKIFSFFYFF